MISVGKESSQRFIQTFQSSSDITILFYQGLKIHHSVVNYEKYKEY